MSDMAEYDSLDRKEKRAFRAWFHGGSCDVTQFSNKPDDVNFGKAECEWVSFKDFWLGKLVNLGWITVTSDEPRVAKGIPGGQVTFTKYKLKPTDLGYEIYQAVIKGMGERNE